jgi:hypothetical protein
MLSEEILKTEYIDNGLTRKELAEKYQVKEKNIKNALIKYNIKRIIKNKFTEEEELRIVEEYKLETISSLAKKYKVTNLVINRILVKYGKEIVFKRPRKNLSGKRYHDLLVIEPSRSRDGLWYWLCKCDCGKTCEIVTARLLNGNTKSCGCRNNKTCDQHHSWTGYKEISGRYWYSLQNGAKNRNLCFDITKEYAWELFIKQNRKCFYTKIDLIMQPGDNKRVNLDDNHASLDRIDSSKGYIEGNVVWVHKNINTMKLDMSHKEFVEWCSLVYKGSLNG